MIRKFIKTILTLLTFVIPLSCTCIWINGWDPSESDAYKFPYDPTYVNAKPTTELQDQVDIDKEYGEKSILKKLLEVFWLNRDALYWDHKFIYYVRAILNMALWLLSLIALIMVMYTFYTMFFSDNDKSVENAKWNLVGIFIALGIIWLSWLIVSFIFRWFQDKWKKNEDKIWENVITSTHIEPSTNNQLYLTI